jgi:hypothetical protein
VPPVDSMQDLRTEMVLTMESLGIPIEAHHHEVATAGQAEIDMRFTSLTRMADNLMIYKNVVKNVARKHGMTATFMPKPLFEDNASGMHVHQSIWKRQVSQWPRGTRRDSALGIEPRNDLRPYSVIRVPPDQNREMLQTDSEFARILDDKHIPCKHRIGERLDRSQRSYLIGRGYHRKRGGRQTEWPNQRSGDFQESATKTVFAVKPPEDLVHQLAWNRHLVESPALDPSMDIKRLLVADAEHSIH